ncbi:DUF2318 domain-containing protein [Ruminiclostridium cellulolyticum]|uniref:Membrane iron-sulfur containing protein FtrD-like domain-containing protein n=1 Tax=Ruminiclostridium cellulolyticum (strain ATCC 35319 / DSM 5812 / JCM 6584 / H10) TaxID=394503 RepID=B8I2S4_RUMCH|nr:DUF2318 domain-containing protein [Ruminiclostridium cellulolyticum]ACL76067.1 conserved hypothetical protein [Ruminiclostridium cellulolyticum H10]
MKNSYKLTFTIIGAIIVVLAVILIVKFSGNDSQNTAVADIVIPKSQITDKVTFYPLKTGKTNMEVLAVKASDGTIRTAFNTCQVCNGSPRAYYKQEGEVIVCQNCGNRFSTDMIEQQRGGCNPIPIYSENRNEDAENITITKNFIENNKGLFTANWKTE